MMTTFWPDSFYKRRVRGFTLVELMVAMGITTIILTLLVSITSVALDGWRISRNKVRAARQAKEAINQMSKDLESLVIRSGNNFEWLYAGADSAGQNVEGGDGALLAFYTVATDRYDGKTAANPGDISAVGYRLVYKDPVAGSQNQFSVYSLYRNLIDPDVTFNKILASEALVSGGGETATGKFDDFIDTGSDVDNVDNISNFVCENIYEMSVGFVVEFTVNNSVTEHRRFTVTNGSTGNQKISALRVKGNRIITDPEDVDVVNGRVVSIDVALTVISDHGMGVLRNNAQLSGEALEQFLEKNSYRYTKSILLPQS